MKKVFKISAGFAAVFFVGGGISFGAWHYLSGSDRTISQNKGVSLPTKPLFFTDVSDVTVSIPPEPGAPPTSFVQVGIQFSTYNPIALVDYARLQPIIKSQIIGLLMTQTSSGMADAQTRASITKSCLDISNNVVTKNSNLQFPVFTAAYITNLVVQE